MRIHPHLTVEYVVTFSWDCTMIWIVLHWFRGNVYNLYQQRALKKLWSKCTRTSIVCENKGSKNRKTSNLRHDWVDHQCASSSLLRNKSQLMVFNDSTYYRFGMLSLILFAQAANNKNIVFSGERKKSNLSTWLRFKIVQSVKDK